MRWFNNMKIGAKLILSFIIVAIISGIVGAIGIQNITKIDENAVVLYENVTIPLSQSAEMAKLFQRVRVITRDMILESDTNAINDLYDDIQTIVTEMNTYGDSFKSTMIAENIIAAYTEFDSARSNYRGYFEQLLQLCLENKDEEAFTLVTGEMNDAALKEQDAIDKLIQLKVDAAKDRSEQNEKTLQSAIITMVAVIAAGMMIAIILGVFISKIISNPIRKVSKAAELIADGDLNVELDITTKDEIGSLAASFRKMVNNLNEVMFNIGLAAEQVASGSKQVSDSSMALSQGATEQASSIEELSSSIEEIAAQTKNNADNAIQANQLAEAAKDNASSGNDQMKDMLKAMEEINLSSNNISKIIKVIDDIAFQTNILALNAAVEAARAGQHGKGFAVVAEEVRNLAARSAKASKETTDMIEGSMRKVDGGMKIANQTAQALTSIVDNVTKVASLVGSIAVASNEQASGVEQINQGIMQVSTVVQTNSATSEESAAASEELSSQAELMREQVLKFKLKKQDRSYPYYQDKDYSGAKPVVKQGNSEGSRRINSPGRYKAKDDIKIILNDAEFGKY